jgi:hypothetical protein
MKTFWFGAACVVVCVMTVWYSRTTYGEPPRTPETPRMIAMEHGAILDANQILFVEEEGDRFRIAFRGVPSRAQGNGAYSFLYVKKSPENRRRLTVATGVVLRPPDEDREERNVKSAVK